MTPVNATLACKLQGICVFLSNKPWITKDIQLLLKACNTVFRSGDMQTWSIRDDKAAYKWRIEDHFGNWDPRRAWQGIRHNTSSLTSSSAVEAEQLNLFFGRFEVDRTRTIIDPAPAANNQALVIQSADVTRTLCRLNPRKAAGPDGIPAGSSETMLQN